MTPPPEVATALATMEAEYAALMEEISQMHHILPTVAQMSATLKQRDRLASAIGNLKGYYAGR